MDLQPIQFGQFNPEVSWGNAGAEFSSPAGPAASRPFDSIFSEAVAQFPGAENLVDVEPQQEIDFQGMRISLDDQIKSAMAAGDLTKLAFLQQQYDDVNAKARSVAERPINEAIARLDAPSVDSDFAGIRMGRFAKAAGPAPAAAQLPKAQPIAAEPPKAKPAVAVKASESKPAVAVKAPEAKPVAAAKPAEAKPAFAKASAPLNAATAQASTSDKLTKSDFAAWLKANLSAPITAQSPLKIEGEEVALPPEVPTDQAHTERP